MERTTSCRQWVQTLFKFCANPLETLAIYHLNCVAMSCNNSGRTLSERRDKTSNYFIFWLFVLFSMDGVAHGVCILDYISMFMEDATRYVIWYSSRLRTFYKNNSICSYLEWHRRRLFWVRGRFFERFSFCVLWEKGSDLLVKLYVIAFLSWNFVILRSCLGEFTANTNGLENM